MHTDDRQTHTVTEPTAAAATTTMMASAVSGGQGGDSRQGDNKKDWRENMRGGHGGGRNAEETRMAKKSNLTELAIEGAKMMTNEKTMASVGYEEGDQSSGRDQRWREKSQNACIWRESQYRKERCEKTMMGGYKKERFEMVK